MVKTVMMTNYRRNIDGIHPRGFRDPLEEYNNEPAYHNITDNTPSHNLLKKDSTPIKQIYTLDFNNKKIRAVSFTFKSEDEAIQALKKAYSKIYDDVTHITNDSENGLMIYHSTSKYDDTEGYDGSNHIDNVDLDQQFTSRGVEYTLTIHVRHWHGLDNLKVNLINMFLSLGYEPNTDLKKAEPQLITKPTVINPIPIQIDNKHTLQEEMDIAKFIKGKKVLSNLNQEWNNLKCILDNHLSTNNNLIDTDKIGVIALGVYQKALDFLSLALNTYKQINLTDIIDLNDENDELTAKLNINKANSDSKLCKTLQEAIDKNNNTLKLIKQKKDNIDELFGQISLCKDALIEMRLNLPELLNHQSTDELNKTILEAKDRINLGQRLLDEYKKQGL